VCFPAKRGSGVFLQTDTIETDRNCTEAGTNFVSEVFFRVIWSGKAKWTYLTTSIYRLGNQLCVCEEAPGECQNK
jgi:hypothetical protein